MDLDINWGSHLPVLISLIKKTSGSVLEMGTGFYSTPFLHWACFPDRYLISYENNMECFRMNKKYSSTYHKVIYVKDWDEASIESYWDIAFIDHSPSQRRMIDIKRLANYAKFIIVHDTQRGKHFWGGEFPYFKYRLDYKTAIPYTTVFSNFIQPTLI